MTWLMLAVAVISEVVASLSLKGSATTPALYALVVVGYVTGFVMLTRILKRGMPLGVAYGIWGAAGVALTAVSSTLIFGEAFTPLMGVGLAFIIAGVVLVENGSRPAELDDAADPRAADSPDLSPREPEPSGER